MGAPAGRGEKSFTATPAYSRLFSRSGLPRMRHAVVFARWFVQEWALYKAPVFDAAEVCDGSFYRRYGP
jgi:hypothetical protein